METTIIAARKFQKDEDQGKDLARTVAADKEINTEDKKFLQGEENHTTANNHIFLNHSNTTESNDLVFSISVYGIRRIE